MNPGRSALLRTLHELSARAQADSLSEGTLAVAPHGVDGCSYLAADARGHYAVVVRAQRGARTQVPIRMASISADFGATYTLDLGRDSETLRVAVVRCDSSSAEIRSLFVEFADVLLASLPADPTESDLASELGKWLGLFSRLQRPSQTDVVGLIGELCVLHHASDPGRWVRAWHQDPVSTIDFVVVDPDVLIEVKSTRSASRRHRLSADQAFGVLSRHFASVQVDLRESGGTLGEFARELSDRFDSEEDRLVFWSTVTKECGEDFALFMSERFVWASALSTTRFYSRECVPLPHIEYPLPAGITGLSFVSDFSDAPSQTPTEFFRSVGVV